MDFLLKSLVLMLVSIFVVTAQDLVATTPPPLLTTGSFNSSMMTDSSSSGTAEASNSSSSYSTPGEDSSSSPSPSEVSFASPSPSDASSQPSLPSEAFSSSEDFTELPSSSGTLEERQGPSMSFSTPSWLYVTPARGTCPESDQIHCKNSDRCTRIRYICDGDNDCGDNSDENSALCRAWRNSDCERNNARCRRNGRSDCITISHYCELDNPPCEGSVDPRLCKMLSDEKIQDLDSIVLDVATESPTVPVPTVPSVHYNAEMLNDEFKDILDSTIRHSECPQLYTKIGDQCVSVFFIGNLTWMESRAFCQAIGGDLFTIRPDLSNFLTVLQHLNKNQVTKDFWIGGMYKNSSLGWQWVDETSMQSGSPIWAVRHFAQCAARPTSSPVLNITREANDGYCYHYQQAPGEVLEGHCAAITFEHYYYVSDADCMTRKSPLCVTPDDHPKQAL